MTDRYLFYYYTHNGMLVFTYSDYEMQTVQRYVSYNLKSAISKFRKDFNLQHKRIYIKNLYEGE